MKKKRSDRTAQVDSQGIDSANIVLMDNYNPFRRYLQEANRYPLLSEEEEKAMTNEFYRTQDPELGRKLALSNLRLVIKIAMEYYYKVYANLTDLVQEGNIGLLMAIKKYDPSKGIRLASYAQFWIRAYMLKYLLNSYSLVKIGTTRKQRKVFYNLGKAKEALENLGFKADAALLADHMNVDEKDVMLIEGRMQNRDVSLDAPVGEDGNRTVADTIIQAPRFELDLQKQDIQNKVRQKLDEFYATLEEKDKFIWDHRLMNENKMTLDEIATQFSISKERVRQLEERMKKKLKKFWETNASHISIKDMLD
jgi:RNA polymerase sigma-32 factor